MNKSNNNAENNLFLPIIITFCVTSCNIGAINYPEESPFKNDTKEYSVMEFFNYISGKYTLTSMHNREPNREPARQTNRIRDIIGGKYPGMWSGDFLYQEADVNSRWTMIYECEKQWKAGSIVQLMLHVVSPRAGVVDGKWNGLQHYNRWEYLPDSISVMSKLESGEWTDLLRNGGMLNSVWKERLDDYAQYFQYLKEKEVNVLFRPFHEMNQTSFWWNSGGAGNTAGLFRLTRDYLVNEKGLDNIIWVWNLQDIYPISVSEWKRYDPGSGYWDIFTVDIYGGSFNSLIYDTALGVAGDKPIAIGECFSLPAPGELLKQQKWVFAMPWADDTFNHNTEAALRNFYLAANTLTRDELPKFKYTGSASAPKTNFAPRY